MSLNIAVRDLSEDCDLLEFYFLNPERYPFLLESVAKSASNHFDILFAFPYETISPKINFLSELEVAWDKENIQHQSEYSLPFYSGWFLMLNYELNLEIEPVLNHDYVKSIDSHCSATRVKASIVQDKQNRKIYFVTESKKLLDAMLDDYNNLEKIKIPTKLKARIFEQDDEVFLKGVKKIKNYIVEGDVFQVNLSRLWQLELAEEIDPGIIYHKLRQTNPAPFAGFAKFAERAIISSSPERLVNIIGDTVSTRPIAGTRPRGESKTQDSKLSKELLRHPKEQAEHIMLIDLERNDLGRVCIPGTIEVDELMLLETYAHVHHIVSNVRGKLRPEVKPVDVIRASFPGGTITGCPKVRCMQIINELEAKPRKAYTGSMGYLDLNGNMDLNILIRTMEQTGKQIQFRAGSGIVHDSKPDMEVEETRAKAEGMLRVFR